MRSFAATLWHLLGLAQPAAEPPRRRAGPPSSEAPTSRSQKRYDALVDQMKTAHGIRVHRWRSSTSGCAWELKDRRGAVTRMIESPYPRGPVSTAVFLHEVGHHAIGFNRDRPRCLEEWAAWEWSLAAMETHGITITQRVVRRRDAALRYAVSKAIRRGIKRIPAELLPWTPVGVVSTPSDHAGAVG